MADRLKLSNKWDKRVMKSGTVLNEDSFGNFSDDTHKLLLNARPYLEKVVLGLPNRSSENRIIYIHKGTARVKINFIPYELKEDDVLLIPANYIMVIEDYSTDVEPWLLDFNYRNTEEKEMVGIETVLLHLDESEKKVVNHYYMLMHQINLAAQRSNDDQMHLIMSFLYFIHQMRESREKRDTWEKVSRAKQIKSEFVNMVVTQDVPQLSIAEYAKALNVSENYLSIIIKNETHQTVKKWIEQKTETTIKLLLTEPKNHTLGEIAEIVGYSSPPQVVRFFKRRTGMTPYEYRKLKMAEKSRIGK